MEEYSIKKILMERDSMSSGKADDLISDAKQDLDERLAAGEDAQDICADWFGLEPDFIMDLI